MKSNPAILTLFILLSSSQLIGQGIDIKSTAYVRVSGAASVLVQDGGIINNGTYTKGTETVTLSGTAAKTISGISNTSVNNMLVTNTGGITTQVGLLTTNLLTISTGSKFTVDAGKAVTALGTTSLGSPKCLVLKSTATATASFIDNGTVTAIGGGTAIIERYLSPYTLVEDLKFHFLSSPVGNAQAIQNEFINLASSDITDFYKWNEVANEWTNFRGASYNTRNESFGDGFNFVAGKGYMVAYPTTVTKNFVGAPFSGDLTVSCTNTANRGWNMLGNPYPSSIDWTQVTRGDGMDAALYFYDNSLPSYRYYIQHSGTLGPEVGGGAQYIPPMQGFMVHAKTSGTQTVTFSNAARTHAGQDVFYKKSVQSASNILNMKVAGNGMVDYARVCFYDEATDNFDGEFDAFKLFSYSAAMPQLYSVTADNTSLAINTLPVSGLEGITPLGFKAGTEGDYQFTAENIESFNGASIYLKDLKTGALQNLTYNPVYSFTSKTGDNANRFELIFGDFNGMNEHTASDFNIYALNNSIQIRNNKSNEPYTVMVSNMLGQVLFKSKLASNTINSINACRKPGMYVVTVTSQGMSMSRKVVIE